MNTKKADITQIRRYLNGELDARAMHRLERESQDDPFLLEALEGYEANKHDPQDHLNQLAGRLQNRIIKTNRRIIPFRILAIAASFVIALGIGGFWLINRQPEKQQTSLLLKKQPQLLVSADTISAPSSIIPQTTQPAKVPGAGKTYASVSKSTTSFIPLRPKADNDVVDNAAGYLSPSVSQQIVANGIVLNDNPSQKPVADTLKKIPSYIFKKPDTAYADKQLLAKIAGVKATPMQGDLNTYKKAKLVNGIIVEDDDKTPTGLYTTVIKPDHNYTQQTVPGDIVVSGYAAPKKKEPAGYFYNAGTDGKKGSNADVSSLIPGQAAVPVAKEKQAYTVPAAAPHLITGTVTDRQGGQPLPGAVVKIKGTVAGVITDSGGHFKLNNADNRSIVTVSSIGYQSKVIAVNGADSLHVALDAGANSLAEVVITNNGATNNISTAHPITGWIALKKYLEKEAISPDGQKGIVKLSFMVDKSGRISAIKVIKSLSAATDQEAIKLIDNGSAWAGNSNGKPEKITIKVKFN